MDCAKLICASDGVTSNTGIDYGGVDEDGSKEVESRRRRKNVWHDDDETAEHW